MKPTETEIRDTIAILQTKLKSLPMKRRINRAVREGYTLAVTILAEGKDEGRIKKLPLLQSRAIASLALDYLAGDTSRESFLSYGPDVETKPIS